MKESTTENAELLRNIQNYQEDLRSQDSSQTGVKIESIFNELPYFHVTQNYAPDIMHDILGNTQIKS